MNESNRKEQWGKGQKKEEGRKTKQSNFKYVIQEGVRES